MTAPSPVSCASCRAPITGPFCSQCGSATGPRRCGSCQADLSAGARFCHQCGAAAQSAGAPRKERTTLVVIGLGIIATVATVAFLLGRGRLAAPPAPAMANAGNAEARTAPRAPDISNMSPRERFDRLFGRVMRAAESEAADSVMLFSPMALQAYEQLGAADIDSDARYHAAMIHMVVGEFAAAKAKADTILAAVPTHLFGFVIRAEVALQENDSAVVAKNYRAFLAAYDAETKAGRKEYLEHPPMLADFKNRAQAAQ